MKTHKCVHEKGQLYGKSHIYGPYFSLKLPISSYRSHKTHITQAIRFTLPDRLWNPHLFVYVFLFLLKFFHFFRYRRNSTVGTDQKMSKNEKKSTILSTLFQLVILPVLDQSFLLEFLSRHS